MHQRGNTWSYCSTSHPGSVLYSTVEPTRISPPARSPTASPANPNASQPGSGRRRTQPTPTDSSPTTDKYAAVLGSPLLKPSTPNPTQAAATATVAPRSATDNGARAGSNPRRSDD